jgi:endonuclease III
MRSMSTATRARTSASRRRTTPPPSEQDRARAGEILDRLELEYPQARIQLDHRDEMQLLVSVILSAQCTDVRVNQITPGLFQRYRDVAAFAAADPDELAEQIRSCGLFRAKAGNIIGAAGQIQARHDGSVPRTRAQLMALPGIGRKSANVILSNAFGEPAFAVDTHVGRLARRLGLSASRSPDAVERDATALIPRERWSRAHHLLIWHGRQCCQSRKPACERCTLASLCPARQ